MASDSWARGARVAALGGLAFGAVNGVTVRMSLGPSDSLAWLLVLAIIGSLVLWPFCALGFYCATRWVGIEPAPWIWSSWRPVSRLVVVSLVGSVILFVGSIALAIVFAPLLEGGTGPIDELTRLAIQGKLVIATTAVWEEALFRFALLFPLFALFGIRDADRQRAPPWTAWLAIGVTGLLFALAHIGNITGAGAQGYLIFSLVQKGLFVGGVLGYMTWRWGIESAILAHFGLDAVALTLTG